MIGCASCYHVGFAFIFLDETLIPVNPNYNRHPKLEYFLNKS